MKEKDKKVLLELIEDGRESLSDIADKVGIARQTVKRRIEQLKERKLIENFCVNLSEDKIGLSERAYIILEAKPSSEERRKLENMVKSFEEVSQFHYLFGRFDAIIEIKTYNEDNLHYIIEKIHDFDVVEDTETLIVHSRVKDDSLDPIRKVLNRE
mgnify:CR=1 FL=1